MKLPLSWLNEYVKVSDISIPYEGEEGSLDELE